MKRFLLLYAGVMSKFSQLDPRRIQSVNAEWGQWAQSIGEALVDPGAPIAEGRELVDNGEQLDPLQINGYAMVQAEDISGALALAQNHPWLNSNKGKYSIVALEIMAPQPVDAQAQPVQPVAAELPTMPPQQTVQPDVPPTNPQQEAPEQTPAQTASGELNISHESLANDPTQQTPPQNPGTPA